MKAIFRNWLLLLILAVVATGQAQTGRGFVTLEALVGGAENVYKGVLVDVTTTDPNPDGNFKADITFTVRVDQTIKGRPIKSLQFKNKQTRYFLNMAVYRSWIQHGTSFIWFDNGKQDTPQEAYLQWDRWRLDPAVPEENRYTPQDRGLLSMELKSIREPQEILSKAVEFAKKYPKKLQIYELGDIPPLIDLPEPPTLYNNVYVPVIPELETLAQAMVEKPDSFLIVAPRLLSESSRITEPNGYFANVKKGAEGRMVQLGIKALKFFKSAKNIALLMPYLQDPTTTRVHFVDFDAGKPAYPIRQAAYKVLSDWKVKVDKPDLGVESP